MTAALWLIAVNLGLVALALLLISREVADLAQTQERQADALEEAIEEGEP